MLTCMAQGFVTSFTSKIWNLGSIFTTKMLTHGKLQIEQMVECGLLWLA
jgi:hypothetical protein